MQFGNVTLPPTLSFLLAECANLHLLACLLHFNIDLHYIFYINFFFFKCLFFSHTNLLLFKSDYLNIHMIVAENIRSLFVTSISNGLHSNSVVLCRKSIFSAYQGVRMCTDFSLMFPNTYTRMKTCQRRNSRQRKKKKKQEGKKRRLT